MKSVSDDAYYLQPIGTDPYLIIPPSRSPSSGEACTGVTH